MGEIDTPARRPLWDAINRPGPWWSRVRDRLTWAALILTLAAGAGVVFVVLVKAIMAAWLTLLSAVSIPAWVIGLVVDGGRRC